MPTLSIFYGIVIQMYWDDHTPPHFHARYAEFKATFGIEDIVLLTGTLPARAEACVFEWARLHQNELLENWRRCQAKEHPFKIEPLK